MTDSALAEIREYLDLVAWVAKSHAQPCHDESGRFSACSASGNSAEGSERRRQSADARKRRRKGGHSGVGDATRRSIRRRRGRAHASRRAWEHAVDQHHYYPEHRELRGQQQRERNDLAADIKHRRKTDRKDELAERKHALKDIRSERRELREGQVGDRRSLKRRQAKEHERLDVRQARQTSALEAKHAAQREKHGEAKVAERHREQREELAQRHEDERTNLKDDHRGERMDLRGDQRTARDDQRSDHRSKIDDLRDAEQATRFGSHSDRLDEIADLRTAHRLERAERHHADREYERGDDDGGKSIAVKAPIDAALDRLQAAADRLLKVVGEAGEKPIDDELWAGTVGWKGARKPKPPKAGGKPGSKPHAKPCHDAVGHFAACGIAGGAKPKPPRKPRPQPVTAPAISKGKARRAYADAQERHVAEAVGGKALKDYEPSDVVVPKPNNKGNHVVEVKSILDGNTPKISVHANAWVRKIDHAAANPKDTFHTIVVDKRGEFDGGAHAEKYSGHEVYYKRASGPYFLTKMYKCRDLEHAKKLMEAPDSRLPRAAKGKFPVGERLDAIRAKAEEERAYNNARSKARKERLGRAAYGKE